MFSDGSADPRRLVVDLQRHLFQLVGVLLAVVRTEEEVVTAGERHSHIGLRAATITAIRRVQGGVFDDCSAHVGLSFLESDPLLFGGSCCCPKYNLRLVNIQLDLDCSLSVSRPHDSCVTKSSIEYVSLLTICSSDADTDRIAPKVRRAVTGAG